MPHRKNVAVLVCCRSAMTRNEKIAVTLITLGLIGSFIAIDYGASWLATSLAWDKIKTASPFIADVVDFTGDLVTSILGAAAIWAFIFRRPQFLQTFDFFSSAYVAQKVVRLRQSLANLEQLDYQEKTKKNEVRALIGDVCGQLKSLMTRLPELNGIHVELTAIMNRSQKLDEGEKRRLIQEIYGVLDDNDFARQTQLLGRKQK